MIHIALILGFLFIFITGFFLVAIFFFPEWMGISKAKSGEKARGEEFLEAIDKKSHKE
jgi:hypothetical protein